MTGPTIAAHKRDLGTRQGRAAALRPMIEEALASGAYLDDRGVRVVNVSAIEAVLAATAPRKLCMAQRPQKTFHDPLSWCDQDQGHTNSLHSGVFKGRRVTWSGMPEGGTPTDAPTSTPTSTSTSTASPSTTTGATAGAPASTTVSATQDTAPYGDTTSGTDTSDAQSSGRPSSADPHHQEATP